MALRPRSRPCTVPSPTSASGRKLRPLRGNPPSSFRFSRASPVEGSGFEPSVPSERGQGLSLRLSPHEPSFFDTEVFGLLPAPRGSARDRSEFLVIKLLARLSLAGFYLRGSRTPAFRPVRRASPRSRIGAKRGMRRHEVDYYLFWMVGY